MTRTRSSPPDRRARNGAARPARGAPSRRDVAQRLHSGALRLLRRLRQEDDALTAGAVGPAQLSALSVLVFAGERTLGELARAEGVRPATMSRLVAALAAAGLVERHGDASDRRRVRLRPSAQGRRLLLAGRDRRVEALEVLLQDLDPSAIEVLDRAATLLAGLVARGGERPGPK